MRIAIVTFTYGDNFGQRLQNYALQEVIKSIGAEVYTLKQKKPKYPIKRHIKNIIGNVLSPRTTFFKVKRSIKFRDFNDKYIRFEKKPISENEGITGINDKYDKFVCGSDQIWSPFTADVNGTLFLEFAPKEKRISYAASIAANYIPNEKKAIFVKRLKGFDEISIREVTLREWIKKNTGILPRIDLDPTLLLDSEDWDRIISKPFLSLPDKYVLLYFLGDEYDKYSIIEKYGFEKNRIVDLNSTGSTYAISPSEFVYLVKNADIIITDSYHGTLFSIIYHKKFVIYDRKDNLCDMSSRFETICGFLGIDGRKNNEMEKDDLYKEIDYKRIDKIIAEKKEESLSYIVRRIKA